MITFTYDLDVVPGIVPLVVPLKQYEDDVKIIFNVFSRVGTLNLQEGTTVSIRGTKPDGNGISIDASLSGSIVTANVDKQMTAVAGKALYELVFTNSSGDDFITASFVVFVQRAALDKDTLKSGSVIRELVDIIDRTDDIIAAANLADTSCKAVDVMHKEVVDANESVNTKAADVDLKAKQVAAMKIESDTLAKQALEKASNAENEVAENQNTLENLKKTDNEFRLLLEGKIDGAYVDQGCLYLTSNGSTIAGPFGPFSGTGGGSGGSGGNSASLSVTNTTGWLSKTIADGSECEVSVLWNSVEDNMSTGNGTAKITVNGIVKAMLDIEQGEVKLAVAKYLSVGANIVKVTISDVYGNSRTINFSITSIALSLTSTFDATVPYTGAIIFPFTPTGSVLKTVHFILDDAEIGTMQTSVSGRQQSFVIPQQSHGAHKLKCYFDCEINGQLVPSNELYFEIMCLEDLNNDIIIASDFNLKEVKQYTTLNFNCLIYNPLELTSEAIMYVNGVEVLKQTVGRVYEPWPYRVDNVGEMNVEIVCGNARKPFNFTVVESDVKVEAETEALALHLTSSGRSNNEAEPGKWSSGNIEASLINFNFVSDGWQRDKDGITVLRTSGDARVTIPYNVFANDFRTTGKTIEIEFATREVLDYDAIIMSCMSGGRGIEITAQKAMLVSSQSNISTQYKEDEHVRIAFVVEKKSENRLLYCYINGILSGVTQYPADDDFTQVSPVGISIGSSDCTVDVYNIRVYDNNLTRHQVLDNWIADTQNVEDMLSRYQRNLIYDTYGKITIANLSNSIGYLVIQCDALPQFKGDKKLCSGYYVDPINPSKSFTFVDAEIDVQGTSSQYYYVKNYKIKFKGGFILTNGTTVEVYQLNNNVVPTNTYTFKADVASQEGANNVVLAKLYNELCPVKTPPQEDDPRVRQTIDGHPIVVFWDNGNETQFVGKYNFNHDKGTEEVFGFEPGDESWEILQNGTDRVGWKSADYSGDGWKADFEARYPDGNIDVTKLKTFAEWIVATNSETATGNALTQPVTYENVEYTNDTAEYRLAKFKAELANHANIDALVFYYVFTETFLCIDQREKNGFPTWFARMVYMIWLFYDADSSLGTDNKGNLAFDYYLEDIDYTEAGDPIFNGQGSVLWVNIRKCFYDRITAEYQRLRTTLRNDGSGLPLLSYEVVDNAFEAHQSKWCEAVYNEDGFRKSIEPLLIEGDGMYLPMLQGKKEQHRRWWLYNRFRYLDSKYVTGSSMSTRILIRAHQKANVKLISYVNMYGHVYYNAEMVEHRMFKGQEYEFVWTASGAEDPVIGINDADMLTSIGDLTQLMAEEINVAPGLHLTSLKAGSADESYQNLNLVHLTLGNNTLMRLIDVRGCTKLGTGEQQTVDISGCTNVEEVYFDRTAVKGVILPVGGILRKLHLPATVTNLTVRNHTKLEEFVLPSRNQIATLRLEHNNDVIDDLTILKSVAAGSRVRIIGFDWTFESPEEILEFYDYLDTMRGLDEGGNNTAKAQMSGTIRVDSLTGAQMAEMQSRYPMIKVVYNRINSYLYYYNEDGSQLLHTETIQDGGDGTHVNNYTKDSTAQYHFTPNGWSKTPNGDKDDDALIGVIADRNVYATYIETIRTYTAKFYSGSTLLQTVSNVPYGTIPKYTGSTPTNNSTGNIADFEFVGWSPSLTTGIKADTSYYAQFYDLREITDSWATIASNVANGTAESKYSVGAFKTLNIGEVKLPYNFYGGSAVVYNNELYIFGTGTNSYKWNGIDWIQLENLPVGVGADCSDAVVYNDKIHLFVLDNKTSNSYHYVYDGVSWTALSLPSFKVFDVGAKVCVYNNEIHTIYSKSHCMYNGSEWVQLSTLANKCPRCELVVYDEKMYLFGGNGGTNYHYEWTGSEWITLTPSLPYYAPCPRAVVLNNELHLLGTDTNGSTKHSKFNGSTWIEVGKLPYKFNRNSVIVYNNKIHILGSGTSTDTDYYTAFYYYIAEESRWTPYVTESIPMQIVAHNHDELASGIKWEILPSLNVATEYQSAVELNNEIYMLESTSASASSSKLYKYNGTEWEYNVELKLPYANSKGTMIVFNGEIHHLGGNSPNNTKHYKFDGSKWSEVSTLPYLFSNGSAVVYNNELHIIGSNKEMTKHYKWDGISWTEVSTLPYNYYGNSVVVYNGEIHIFGTSDSSIAGSANKNHYKWNGTEWTSVSTLPYGFEYGSAIVYNDEIHIFGSKDMSSTYSKHYKWNGVEWVECLSTPNNSCTVCLVVYKGLIYFLGGGNSKTTNFYRLNTDHPKATLTFVAQNLLKDNISVNRSSKTYEGKSGFNAGGWMMSDVRTYCNEDLFNQFPPLLQQSIKEVKKVSDFGCAKYELSTTEDKVWLLSFDELNNPTDVSEKCPPGQGSAYSVFDSDMKRIKTKVDSPSQPEAWWSRTSDYTSRDDWGRVWTSGSARTFESSTKRRGILIGFCI